MTEAIARIIVDCVLFLQLSDDSQVNADAAVEQTEQIAWQLKRLAPEERTEFLKYVSRFASQAEKESGRDSRWQCLADMPEALGLLGSSQE
ncbi:MAG: hypothetical protein LLG01_13460 [Planctomycetaceae bacterium]|nr:hypothetical protein [Planctomycetaceae bacterium]